MSGDRRAGQASKIKAPLELAGILARLQDEGQRIVHCHGVFDLLHPGHIRHLASARQEGDVLVVSVAPDYYADEGPGRPAFNQNLRAESLAALQFVDYVVISEWPTASGIIRILRPDVYVKEHESSGSDGDRSASPADDEEAVAAVGGRLHFTDEITFSSSHLINNQFHVFPRETEEWLTAFRRRYSADQVLQYLDAAATLRVLVLGEAIIDEYVFCDGLGKSTKDPILAFQYRSTETYAGGSLAVANHLAGFCNHVDLITLLGETDRQEDFVRRALLPNVRPIFLTRQGAPTIHKRRLVDIHTSARLFELYMMDDSPLNAAEELDLRQSLADVIREDDVAVVADFGHGMLTPGAISVLCERARFLAVNTQANAGNRGFNTISRYPRADYVCLAGHEVALETRMRHGNWRDLVLEVTKRIDCSRFTVTHGMHGSAHYAPDSGYIEVPALAIRVADRVGAGDAVLAVTSALVALQAPWDIVGFVGNIAGAQMVADLGNRIKVNRESVARHIISLMK